MTLPLTLHCSLISADTITLLSELGNSSKGRRNKKRLARQYHWLLNDQLFAEQQQRREGEEEKTGEGMRWKGVFGKRNKKEEEGGARAILVPFC